MNIANDVREIFHRNGLDFIRRLLEYEKDRFGPAKFIGTSTFEQITSEFGSFPHFPAYPVYFAGNLLAPAEKIVFVGINPGFNDKGNKEENKYLERRGLFEGYCNIFEEFFGRQENYGLQDYGVRYFSNIHGFCKRHFGYEAKFSWRWCHENLVHLDLIPFHSRTVDGLRINDLGRFRSRYFEVILRILEHLNPTQPIFINGWPTVRALLSNKETKQLSAEFSALIDFDEHENISYGRIAGKFEFYGLPFLTRVKGGKDALVAQMKIIATKLND